MNTTQRRTLLRILERPTRSDLRWSDVEALVTGLGGEIVEREGSRVVLVLNGLRGHFHRPHPKPETRKAAVDAVRSFLRAAGVSP